MVKRVEDRVKVIKADSPEMMEEEYSKFCNTHGDINKVDFVVGPVGFLYAFIQYMQEIE